MNKDSKKDINGKVTTKHLITKRNFKTKVTEKHIM